MLQTCNFSLICKLYATNMSDNKEAQCETSFGFGVRRCCLNSVIIISLPSYFVTDRARRISLGIVILGVSHTWMSFKGIFYLINII